MAADLNTITLFLLPERITQAQFFASLTAFTLGNWYPNPAIKSPWIPSAIHPAFDPMDASLSLDLQSLYIAVQSMGGFESVEQSQRWVLVAINMNLWPEEFHQPRLFYIRYLYQYEIYARKVRRLFTARKRRGRDPREYSQQKYILGLEDNDREDYHVACRPWSSADIRLEIKKQGVLDGKLVLTDYYTISPAIQLYVTQKTYLEATEIFENYAHIGLVHFPRPDSIGPLSSISRDEEQRSPNPRSDRHLSSECKKIKFDMISLNRTHIFETHVKNAQEPLPAVTSEELAPFMCDDVDSDASDNNEDSNCGEEAPLLDNMDPDQAQLVEKFGFGHRPQRGRRKIKTEKQRKPTNFETEATDGLTLAECLDRNPLATPVENPAWKTELVVKFGFKQHTQDPESPKAVVKKGKNYEEYMHENDHNSPEIQHFFDERLKLEGRFWQMELDRLEALESRVRGDEERKHQRYSNTPSQPWDQVSAGSRATPENCHSGETYNSSDSEPELFRVIAPPPGFGDMPMSMHAYAQKVAKHEQITMVKQSNHFPPPNKPAKETSIYRELTEKDEIKLSMLPPSHQEQRQQLESYSTGEFARLRKEYIQHEKAVSDLLGSDTYDAPYHSTDNRSYRRSSPGLRKKGSDSQKVLSLPNGQRLDITKVNPQNPPSYNYAQQWLQERATPDDDSYIGIPQMNQINLRHHENTTNETRQIASSYNSGEALGTPKGSNVYPTRSPRTPMSYTAQGQRSGYSSPAANQHTVVGTRKNSPTAVNQQYINTRNMNSNPLFKHQYDIGSRNTSLPTVNQQYTGTRDINSNPTVVIQQFTGIGNMNTKDTKLKLTPSEDLLLSNAFYKYQVEPDGGLRDY
ncbi:hypothetical protein DFP73DRAFT_624276 [Morchella snyderi]|nr:hypothetical protein DFP73DRAFT_624276 [Morchella snyderi]